MAVWVDMNYDQVRVSQEDLEPARVSQVAVEVLPGTRVPRLYPVREPLRWEEDGSTPSYDPLRCTIKFNGLELTEQALANMGDRVRAAGLSMEAFRLAAARVDLAEIQARLEMPTLLNLPLPPPVPAREGERLEPEVDASLMVERGGTRLIDLGED